VPDHAQVCSAARPSVPRMLDTLLALAACMTASSPPCRALEKGEKKTSTLCSSSCFFSLVAVECESRGRRQSSLPSHGLVALALLRSSSLRPSLLHPAPLLLRSFPAPLNATVPSTAEQPRAVRLLTRLASQRPPQAELQTSGGAPGAGPAGASNDRRFATVVPFPAMALRHRAAGSRGRANTGRLGPR
jgi:hypothetical protein